MGFVVKKDEANLFDDLFVERNDAVNRVMDHITAIHIEPEDSLKFDFGAIRRAIDIRGIAEVKGVQYSIIKTQG